MLMLSSQLNNAKQAKHEHTVSLTITLSGSSKTSWQNFISIISLALFFVEQTNPEIVSQINKLANLEATLA